MKNFKLKTRYNDIISFTWIEEEKCYLMDTSSVHYVSVHTFDEEQEIYGVDPEGLYVISVGSLLHDTGKKITRITSTEKGYKIYVY